ncbi:hypothetical protein [Micromonospora sp. NPDC005197]|uniref:hypothetical protein n=1 Tax=Micromonospora sp. NPDC005197 TaxID=3157020 RepID=UPI0033A9138A
MLLTELIHDRWFLRDEEVRPLVRRSIDANAGLSPQLRVPSLLFMVAGWLFTFLAVALERVAELTEEKSMGILKMTALSVALVLGAYAVNLSAAAG